MSLKKITTKIALTALAAIYGNSNGVAGMGNNTPETLNDPDFNNSEISTLKPIFLLKKPALDIDRYKDNPLSHRSHRSHSSHRSHMSSRSSYSTKPKTDYKPSRSTYNPPSTSNNIYTPPKPTYSLGSRVLYLGMEGSDIKALNKLLVEKGYLTSIYKYESSFSSTTKSAVEKIQRENNINVDGQVNTITLVYIQMSNASQPTYSQPNILSYSSPSYNTAKNYQLGNRSLSIGKSGSDVLELKKELSVLGLLTSNVNSDDFDSYTKSAVMSYQRNNGLSVDGIVGPNTLSYIQGSYNANINTTTNYYSNETDAKQGLVYYVTQATSLRLRAESSSAVTDRLRAGDSVTILNSVQEQHWWKVSHDGMVGWVKAHLLRK